MFWPGPITKVKDQIQFNTLEQYWNHDSNQKFETKDTEEVRGITTAWQFFSAYHLLYGNEKGHVKSYSNISYWQSIIIICFFQMKGDWNFGQTTCKILLWTKSNIQLRVGDPGAAVPNTTNKWPVVMASGRESEGRGFESRYLLVTFDPGLPKHNYQLKLKTFEPGLE